MKLKSWLAVPAVLVFGAGLTLALPAMSAVGATSPPSTAVQIKVNSVALLDNGLAVDLPVRYVCPAGSESQGGNAQISAVAHKMLITATASFPIKCTGTFQHISVILDVEGSSFKPGPALAQASIDVCTFDPFFGCTTTSVAHALQLT